MEANVLYSQVREMKYHVELIEISVDCKTACDISQITFYSNEKESLLAPGTQLLVKDVKINGNISEIRIEEVGRVVG